MDGTERPRLSEQAGWEESMELLDRLPSLSAEERAEVIEPLLRNPSPVIRERALRTGAAVLSDERLEGYLREDADDVLRNAGLEMLKLRGHRALPLAVRLLRDRDPDVALQAVLALGHVRDLRALEPLRATLHHADPNVVQAAIEAVGRLGDSRAIPDLLPFLDQDPWLQLATIQALGDLRSPSAVEPLASLLTDLMVGPLAAESLARIGGPRVFEVLEAHWLQFENELDAEAQLALLSHVLEGLEEAPGGHRELRASLVRRLEDPQTRGSVARCLLALGPGEEDPRCLEVLAGSDADPSVLPACLAHRPDLIAELLAQPGKRRAWGFQLAARYPDETSAEDVASALEDDVPPPEAIPSLEQVAGHLRSDRLADAILDVFLRSPVELRAILASLVDTQAEDLRAAHARRDDLDEESEIILDAYLEQAPERLAQRIEGLAPAERRLRVLVQVAAQEDLVRRLPWKRWLEEDPDLYAGIAAKVAAERSLRELLPELRARLVAEGHPDVIRAVGELGDRESVPTLLRILEEGPPNLLPLVLESLGRIGGPAAREAIREAILEERCEARIGYRALSLCAIEEDDALFRRAVGHGDWYVRLACAEVLGRFARPENLAALSQLAADPVAIVAQRALSFLEP